MVLFSPLFLFPLPSLHSFVLFNSSFFELYSIIVFMQSLYIFFKTKVLHGPILCRGLRNVLQQRSKLCIATSSSTIFPY